MAQAQIELAADAFKFAFLDLDQSWASYLIAMERQRLGVHLEAGEVPATFLVADVAGEIVGRVSIRHELNEYLATYGGHIGYAVRPAHRRRGYAKSILTQSLVIARTLGLRSVLLTCDDTNVASIRTIESCGGILTNVISRDDQVALRHYWIET